ncbi:hypothetical protein [Micromonospora aurantiaca (nom. illeg.)]|uniref:hypothetical protein n=1 Tax=Micromonospora aurantiaca (nom. illeg.) TaxID=47850 RepID=UPI0008275DF6|nr:hypothetical protein [Micromonospora aurantiaca]SCL37920.1 hypothetical protein GA0070615_3532 [Micromonospora aurantiaca]
MLPVAFASSTWTATLRRIARTAVAGLVLIAGLQGISAAPAHAAAASHATVASHAVVTEHVAAIEHVATRQAVTAGAAELTAADATTAALRTTGPGTGPAGTEGLSADSAGRVPGVEVVAAADPGRAHIARRGPPRA